MSEARLYDTIVQATGLSRGDVKRVLMAAAVMPEFNEFLREYAFHKHKERYIVVGSRFPARGGLHDQYGTSDTEEAAVLLAETLGNISSFDWYQVIDTATGKVVRDVTKGLFDRVKYERMREKIDSLSERLMDCMDRLEETQEELQLAKMELSKFPERQDPMH